MTPDNGQSIGRTDAGNTEHSVPPFNGIILTEEQVWAGMRVAIIMEGRGRVEVDPKGDPLLMDALIGGVPNRLKFYPVEGGIRRVGNGKDSMAIATGLEGFKPEVRFMPTEVFSQTDVPAGRQYAVFKDGQVVRYGEGTREDGTRAVVVDVDKKGRRSLTNYDYGWLSDHPDFAIPEGVALVPFTRPEPVGGYPPAAFPQPTPEEREQERIAISMIGALHSLARDIEEENNTARYKKRNMTNEAS